MMKTLGIVLMAALTLAAAAQTLTFEKEVHDFGDLTDSDTVSTTIKYSNTGDQELVINNVRSRCGCTVGVPAKMILAPGEESTVKVSFVAKGKRGKQRKPIMFQSPRSTSTSPTIPTKTPATRLLWRIAATRR